MITVSKSDFDRQIVPDDCPDTSYLGTYSARAETQWAIDRQERGDMGRNEYQYWNPCNHTPPGLAANWAHVPNEQIAGAIKTHGNRKQAIRALDLKYIEEDYQRHEALNRGEWGCIGNPRGRRIAHSLRQGSNPKQDRKPWSMGNRIR